MSSNEIFKPKNVAAWALKPKQRPFVVSKADYTSPPKDHVAIQVIDVAVNPIDWLMQDNDVFGLKYPTVFGLDVAGAVVELGEGVDDFRIGQRVIAYVYKTRNCYEDSNMIAHDLNTATATATAPATPPTAPSRNTPSSPRTPSPNFPTRSPQPTASCYP